MVPPWLIGLNRSTQVRAIGRSRRRLAGRAVGRGQFTGGNPSGEGPGEFSLERSARACRLAPNAGSLADGLLLLRGDAYAVESGPRGIRTLDLLNAIETRSQLRYGPGQLPEWTWRDSNPRPLQCD